MSVVTGIIISAVVIGLTVLFILWVLRRGKGNRNESLGSRMWAYNESDISGNQLDRMRNMDDYYKHTNIKPNSMLIFAAVFICISILFLIFIFVFAAMPTQRKSKSYARQVSDDYEDDPELKAYVERMQAAYEKQKKPAVFPKPKKKNEQPDEAKPQTKMSDASDPGDTENAISNTEKQTVFFGRYEQDNNTENGPEDIEWIVISTDGDGTTLISKYILDCKNYGKQDYIPLWSYSDLREWLNGEFLTGAFSDSELSSIKPVLIGGVPEDESVSGFPDDETENYVYVLSRSEVGKYMPDNESRICEATAYANSQGVNQSSENGKSWWWTRDCEKYAYHVLTVNNRGMTGDNICAYADETSGGVRPVITVNSDVVDTKVQE